MFKLSLFLGRNCLLVLFPKVGCWEVADSGYTQRTQPAAKGRRKDWDDCEQKLKDQSLLLGAVQAIKEGQASELLNMVKLNGELLEGDGVVDSLIRHHKGSNKALVAVVLRQNHLEIMSWDGHSGRLANHLEKERRGKNL